MEYAIMDKVKNKFTFTGTYQEFMNELHIRNFWHSEEDYKNYISLPRVSYKLSNFNTYFADIKAGVIFEHGLAYASEKMPTYPDKILIELKTEGYSQEEINQAFGKALNELEKMNRESKNEMKAFIMEKQTV